MQYSDTTLATDGIIQREEALCLLGDGGISGNSTLLKQFTMYNNAAYLEVWAAELSVSGLSRPDDYNYTDYPDSSITLVASQADYTLPVAVSGGNLSSFLRLKGVYYTLNGMRVYLDPMTDTDQLYDIDGVPDKYQLNGKSIFFNFRPSSSFLTQVTAIHIEFARIPDAFLSTDTTQQAGFLATYHELIPLKASSTYLKPVNPQLSQLYANDFYVMLEKFKRDVAKFDDNVKGDITSEAIRFI